MARKQTRRGKDVRGGALGDFAEQAGTLLGQMEARWRTFQGAETREAIVDSVKGVRDRATALLKDMGVELPFGAASGTGRAAPARKTRKAAKPAASARQASSRPGAARKGTGRKAATVAKSAKRSMKRPGANGRR